MIVLIVFYLLRNIRTSRPHFFRQPDRDQVHFLNPTAALVLELCDGRNDAHDIEALVAEAYGIVEPKQSLTGEILGRFSQEGIIYLETVTDEEAFGGENDARRRRDALR